MYHYLQLLTNHCWMKASHLTQLIFFISPTHHLMSFFLPLARYEFSTSFVHFSSNFIATCIYILFYIITLTSLVLIITHVFYLVTARIQHFMLSKFHIYIYLYEYVCILKKMLQKTVSTIIN